MNIIFILNSTFPFDSGGRENWLYHVSKRLIWRGHTVFAITIKEENKSEAHYGLPDDLHILPINVPFYHGWSAKILRGPFRFIKSFFVALFFRRAMKSIIEDIDNPRIITLDTVVTPLALSRHIRSHYYNFCASKGPHAAVMSARCPLLKPLFFYLEKRAYACSDEVWSNGYDMENYIQSQGYPSIMVGNGIDSETWSGYFEKPSEYFYIENKKRIVSIGSVLPIKGVAESVKALSLLNSNVVSNYHLVWVGKGNPAPYLNMAKDCRIDEDVSFIGNRKNVCPYAKYADVLLCLSGGGGLSMAALESMVSGAPVVAWDTPVYRQIIKDGVSGFLVPHGNIEELANAIKKAVCLSTTERELMVSAARNVAMSFDWEFVVSKIEERLVEVGNERTN